MDNFPQYTVTIEEFIKNKDADPLTYYNLSILEKSKSLPILDYSKNNIIYDYLDELKNRAIVLDISDEEYMKYQYRPKLVAYDLYGSTELFFAIMAVNGICNIKDFNLKNRKMKALRPSELNTLLNQIYNAEINYITTNRNSINKK